MGATLSVCYQEAEDRSGEDYAKQLKKDLKPLVRIAKAQAQLHRREVASKSLNAPIKLYPVKRFRRSRYYFANSLWDIRKAIERRMDHYADGPCAEKMAFLLHKDISEMLGVLGDVPEFRDRTFTTAGPGSWTERWGDLFQIDTRCSLDKHDGNHFLAVSVIISKLENLPMSNYLHQTLSPIVWDQYEEAEGLDLGDRYCVDVWEQLVEAKTGHWC